MPGQKLGIIAGAGTLFPMVWEEALNQKQQPVVVSFNNQLPLLSDKKIPHLQTALGKIGEILKFLNSHNVKHLIFAGRIQRPSFASLSFDAVGLKWMQKLGIKTFGGDDALLKGITELLEQEGFKIISPKDFLPNLVLKPDVYTEIFPSKKDETDIARGQEVLGALSSADVGQACIVQEGLILGIEAIEGTQKLIERCKDLKHHAKGGVLIKLSKHGQSTLVDLPTIGPDTVEAAYKCALNGIAISANTTQVLEFDRVIKLCNQYKIFLKVIES